MNIRLKTSKTILFFVLLLVVIASFCLVPVKAETVDTISSEANIVSTRNSSNNRYKDFISVFSFTPISETECDVRLSDKTATYAIIPEKVELNGKEYTVTVVAANGFSAASKLELVRIPKSVKTIGSNAFVNCKALTSITLPAVETIGSNAFAMTKMDYLIIPTTVTSVAATILRSTNTQVYVRAILAMAKKNRLVEDNYASAEYIDFPKRPKRNVKTLNDEEIKIFIDGLLNYEDLKIKTALMVFILTGFRRGEVAGLEWKYIDFDKNKIQIQNTIIQISGVGCIEKGPKTEESARAITVSPSLMAQLREYQEWQEADQKSKGRAFKPTDKVFTGEFGKNIHPSMLDKWLNIFLVDCELPHFSLHSLRHTNIAVQLAAGIPLVTVSARAGHSKPSTTSDIYAYVLKSSDTQAVQVMDTLISTGGSNHDDSVNEYKKAKEEMKRLGLTSYEEYMDYLEFVRIKSKQVEKTLNVGQV
ncbi:MAG: tyrosine-type recombinase/integrase [Anaeroplasmataceae bacterium]|nr:tyrosine-type recombinase/integrase [Anaeroplasmataceae bacterium]MDE6414088.1 tyrosine-type recombinase/integrase [Anaeroplasmataceae bacterium]